MCVCGAVCKANESSTDRQTVDRAGSGTNNLSSIVQNKNKGQHNRTNKTESSVRGRTSNTGPGQLIAIVSVRKVDNVSNGQSGCYRDYAIRHTIMGQG